MVIICNKKQLFVKQYGHGIGDVLKNVLSNQYIKSGFKSIGKLLLEGGKHLLTTLIKNPEKISKIGDKERLQRQFPKIMNTISESSKNIINKLVNKEGIDTKEISDKSKEILNQLLYGEGIRNRNYKSRLGYNPKTIK